MAKVLRIIFVLLVISLTLLTIFAHLYNYFKFDLEITLALQRVNIPAFKFLMQLLTQLGNESGEAVTITLAVFLLLLTKQWKDAVLTLFSTLSLTSIGIFFKSFVARPRPDADLIIQVGHFSRPDSFPSGHVLYYIGLYGFLLYLIYARLQKSLLRTILIIILSLMIFLIGVSRIYLGAHWFSDTLGSYLTGGIWLYFMIYLHRKWVK